MRHTIHESITGIQKKMITSGESAAIFERISDGFLMLDKKFRYTYANRQVARMTGRDVESLIGKCLWEVFPDIQDTSTFKAIQKAMKENRYVTNTEYYAPLKIWQENHIYPTSSGLSILIRDLTATRKARQEINDSEKKHKDLFDHNPLPLWIYDLDTCRFLEVNHAAIKHYGYSRKEFLNMTLYDIRSRNNSNKLKEYFKGDYYHETKVWEHIKKNGETIFVEIHSHPIKYNDHSARLVSINDITFKKKFEDALQTSEQRYRRIVETAQEGIWTIDENNQTNFVNKKICEMLEYPSDQIMGESFHNFMDAQGKRIASAFLVKGKKEQNYRFDFRFISKKGNVIWTSIATNPIIDDKGKYKGSLAMITDITERKKVELELLQLNDQLHHLNSHLQTIREEERTNIAREIHDELGQQLTGIKIQIGRLKKAKSDQPEIIEKSNHMIGMVDNAIRTVRKIVTELRPGILDDLGLEAAIEWQAKEFTERFGITCVVKANLTHENFSKEIKTAVFRIFQESLTNVARHANATHVDVWLYESKKNLLLEVTDNGRGITQEQINNSVSFGILGMKERAAILKGDFFIEECPEGGTCVILKIPLP
ncbi:MAG: putative sensor histidine kinase [Bacteroidota bacterium]|nr:putative sensor histidine kinase [Bacteroidota bacterium]